MKSYLACALGALLLLLLLVPPEAGRIPFDYIGDEVHYLTMAQALGESGSPFQVPRLGAPDGAGWQDFPLDCPLGFTLVRLLLAAGQTPLASLVGAWVAQVVLTALAANWAFRHLGAQGWVGAALALVYTFQPFTLTRHTYHFNLTFVPVPILAAATVVLLGGGWPGRRIPLPVGLACLAQGWLFFPYNTWFGALLLGASMAGGSRAARQALQCLACLGLGFALFLAPRLPWRLAMGPNPAVAQRLSGESEIYGLKLRHLVSPRPAHPVAPLNELERLLQDASFPFYNESVTSRLGSLGTLGLALAAFGLLAAVLGKGPPPPPAATLLAGTVLLGTVGGLGALLNALAFPQFRAYNRIVVFTEFYALALLVPLLSRLKGRLVPLFAVAFTVLAVLDQNPAVPLPAPEGAELDQVPRNPQFGRSLEVRSDEFTRDRLFVEDLERRLAPGAMIYQLPWILFPESPPPQRMAAYDHLKPYLHSRALRFSWGWVPGRGDAWHQSLRDAPPARLVAALRRRGFAAIWLDRLGYPSLEDSPAPALSRLLGPPLSVDSSARYLVFSLGREEAPARLEPSGRLRGGLVEADLVAGETGPLWLWVENLGPACRPVLRGRWSDGSPLTVALPALRAGQRTVVRVEVEAPDRPGAIDVSLGLGEPMKTWLR